MRWSELHAILDTRLGVRRIALPIGQVRGEESPVDMYHVVEAVVESDEEADDLEATRPWSVLENARLLAPWLEFEWDSLGPSSSWARICLLSLGGQGSYAYWHGEDVSEVVIAALEPLSPATATAFLRDLLADNGESYGVWLFGCLPSRTVNHRPDLIRAMAVKEFYCEWLERASERDPSLCAELRDRVIGESEEPDHLLRSERALEELKRLGTPVTPEAIRRYLDEEDQAGRGIAEEERSLILDNYFAVSYREQAPRGTLG